MASQQYEDDVAEQLDLGTVIADCRDNSDFVTSFENDKLLLMASQQYELSHDQEEKLSSLIQPTKKYKTDKSHLLLMTV